MKVHVGSGGNGNLAEHKKSKDHAAQMDARKIPKITSFFKTRVPEPRSSAPQPPRLQKQTLNEASVRAVGSPKLIDAAMAPVRPSVCRPNHAACPKMIFELRTLAARLPNSIPEGTLGDKLAPFAQRPYIGPNVETFWEEVADPILNNLIGYGQTDEVIKKLIRRGELGLDGLCNWLEFILTEAGVNETLLEMKVDRLSNAIRSLYVNLLFHRCTTILIVPFSFTVSPRKTGCCIPTHRQIKTAPRTLNLSCSKRIAQRVSQ
jgi:hypothetical protein